MFFNHSRRLRVVTMEQAQCPWCKRFLCNLSGGHDGKPLRLPLHTMRFGGRVGGYCIGSGEIARGVLTTNVLARPAQAR